MKAGRASTRGKGRSTSPGPRRGEPRSEVFSPSVVSALRRLPLWLRWLVLALPAVAAAVVLVAPSALSRPEPPAVAARPTPPPSHLPEHFPIAGENPRAARLLFSLDGELTPGAGQSSYTAYRVVGEGVMVTPDLHVRLQSEAVGTPYEGEMILHGDRLYVRQGETWMSMTSASASPPTAAPLTPAALMPLLADADEVVQRGASTVRGVGVLVQSFRVPVDDWHDLVPTLMPPLAQEEVQLSEITGEVAVGAEDHLVRRVEVTMRGHLKERSERKLVVNIQMDLWDVNDPTLVVQPPANVEP